MFMAKVIIHADGGSRGNPGPSALGVVIEYNGKIKEYSQDLGVRTNNEAEYEAVIFALKKTKALLGKAGAKNREVEVWVDSELLHKQVTGKFKVLDEKIQHLFIQIWNLKIDFGNLTFHHTLREGNKEADRLVNRELDQGTLL
jgi:ribonuclease HI